MIIKFFKSDDSKNDDQQLLPTLKLGDVGDDVDILQEKLKVLDFFQGPVNGSFNETTEIAVKEFQKSNCLDPTGVVDATTWKLLFEQTVISYPTDPASLTLPVLRLGSTGTYVTQLQMQLAQLQYFTGLISSVFDTATESAVKMFQSVNRLTVDGIVGRATWSALYYLYSPLAICEEGGGGEVTPPSQATTYTVQAGDTLFSIARRLGLTVEELMALNNLTNTNLQIGQVLIVSREITTPTPPPTNTQVYTVQAGDTLFSIARRFGMTVEELMSLNNLTSTSLQIGQQLLVRSSNTQIYTVQAGDTLFSIARRFNMTVAELMSLNNLTSTNLQIGQQLLVTSNASSNTTIHTVRAGDTLSSIARMYNTTVDELRRLNNLSSDALSIGQQLIVPNAGQFINHTVAAGESLFSIANRYGTTVAELRRINNLTSDLLSIGQVLRVPIISA